MKAVFKHEVSLYYHSLLAYVFGAFLLEFIGIGAMLYNINRAVANFEYALGTFCIAFVGLVPVLTMRVMAEEKKQKTDQLLSLLPITSTDIVLGKYFAAAIVFVAPMLVACIYPYIFSMYGDVYLPTSYGALVAFIFLGLALIAIVVKKLTNSDAAGLIVLIVCVAALVITYFAAPSALESLLPDLMKKLSSFERFYTFVNGVFDLTGIVYYISIAVFFLFLCVQSWEKKRYNG